MLDINFIIFFWKFYVSVAKHTRRGQAFLDTCLCIKPYPLLHTTEITNWTHFVILTFTFTFYRLDAQQPWCHIGHNRCHTYKSCTDGARGSSCNRRLFPNQHLNYHTIKLWGVSFLTASTLLRAGFFIYFPFPKSGPVPSVFLLRTSSQIMLV